MSCSECDVISLYFMCCSVNGSICLVCLTVFVNCLVKQFAMCLDVVAILMLNVMDMFNNNNNNIYLKSNIQCTYRYEFSGLYNNNIQLQ